MSANTRSHIHPHRSPVRSSGCCTRLADYYDALQNASLWRHHLGQRDTVCQRGNTTLTQRGAACDVLHATDGMEYISFPNEDVCCRCAGDLGGFLRPGWLRSPQTRYLGEETIDGVRAHHWFLLANYDNEYYSSADSAARPLRWLEHENDKGFRPKRWDFASADYSVGAHRPGRFAPPASGCEASCGGYCDTGM